MNHQVKKSEKIFSLSFWIGLLAVPFLIVIFNVIIDPYEYFNFMRVKGLSSLKSQVPHQLRLVKSHQICRQQPTNIIIGTSRVEIGFDPNLPVWRHFPGRTYNMGMAGMGIQELYKTIVHAHFASKNLKLMVVALDFLMFNAHREAVVFNTEVFNFDDQRLLQCSSDSCLKSLMYDVDFFLGKKAMRASYNTIREQTSPGPLNLYLHNGMRDLKHGAFEIVTSKHGHRYVFSGQERAYVDKIWRAGPERRYCSSLGELDALDFFRKIISFAHQNNIDIRLLIAPEHARMLLAIKEAGLWVQFEEWKKDMVRIMNEEARTYNTKPAVLWDFSGFNTVSTESIPKEGDLTPMKWYWEGSHYKAQMGEAILATVLDFPIKSSKKISDFGIPLTAGTLEGHLKDTRTKMAVYEKTHLKEVGFIKKVVREVLKDSNGSNCGHDFAQLVKANEALQKGETKTANSYFQSALRMHQIEREKAERIGVPFREEGFMAAFKLIKSGGMLEKRPFDWIGYQDRGNARKERGNLKGAIEDYTKAIETGPPNTALYYLRGITYAELKDHTHAIDDFKAGLILDPHNVTLKFLLKQSSA